jgi:ribonuclease BN (tRNA processing enzyme)
VDTWEFTVKGEIKEDDLVVRIFAANHIPDTAATVEESVYTTGLVVDGRVLISGDTKFDIAMIQRLAPQCEVIFHDCQHFPGGVHANYQQLKTLAPEIKAKMTLYHLSDGMLDIDVKADGFAGLMEPAPAVYDL